MSTTRQDVQRIRGQAGPGGYILPHPARPTGELVLPVTACPSVRVHEAEVAQAIGIRADEMLECQERLLGDLRGSLEQFDADLGEATRARLRGWVHQAMAVLDWCDAVHTELRRESQWAAQGLQPVDLAAFLRELADDAAGAGLSLQVVGARVRPWWGDVALLGETVGRALDLVRARAGRSNSAVIEIRGDRTRTMLRIRGLGDPVGDPDPALVEAFRRAAFRLGARVTPDDLGPGSPGFVLHLPVKD